MRILLINPLTSTSIYTFSEIQDITGRPAYMPNLALPTLAALTPPDVEIKCVDETVESIKFDEKWDIVGITGYITQRSRMIEIADEFRRRGQLVVIGGPYATLSPTVVRPHADVIFIGEAEITWPQFIEEFRTGKWKEEYREHGTVDIQDSPIPNISKLKKDGYFIGVVQTSRGCPFACEFCDVIIYLGRNQRHKTPGRVVDELEQFYQAGYRGVFLSDDNFTANRKKAAEIMAAVREWNQRKPEPLVLSTQLSIDVARDCDMPLLDLCAEAGLRQAFVGIETPNLEALREVKKNQNVRADLLADVRKIHRRGIMVQAGMITGFDSDTTDTFRAQYEFVQQAGIPIISASLLNAPEGTPLERRLRAENRLKLEPMWDFYLDTNVIPKRMSAKQLRNGAVWFLNKISAPENFLDRVAVLADDMPPPNTKLTGTRQNAVFWDRIIRSYEELDPKYRKIPLEVARLFQRKDLIPAVSTLMYHKHVIKVLKKWDVWNPGLAALPEPDFDLPN
jgi:radical SAM superfamily enzyme YgiQ (UPF0313 family)